MTSSDEGRPATSIKENATAPAQNESGAALIVEPLTAAELARNDEEATAKDTAGAARRRTGAGASGARATQRPRQIKTAPGARAVEMASSEQQYVFNDLDSNISRHARSQSNFNSQYLVDVHGHEKPRLNIKYKSRLENSYDDSDSQDDGEDDQLFQQSRTGLGYLKSRELYLKQQIDQN